MRNGYFHIRTREGCRCCIDHASTLHMTVVQRAVTEPVDDAWNALGRLENDVDRLARKPHAIGRAAGNVQPMCNVALDVLASQGGEQAAYRETLSELPHLGKVQFVAQLGLSDQHDLQLSFAP